MPPSFIRGRCDICNKEKGQTIDTRDHGRVCVHCVTTILGPACDWCRIEGKKYRFTAIPGQQQAIQLCGSCQNDARKGKPPPTLECENCGNLKALLSETNKGKFCRTCASQLGKENNVCSVCKKEIKKAYWHKEHGKVCRNCIRLRDSTIEKREEIATRKCVYCNRDRTSHWRGTEGGWSCHACHLKKRRQEAKAQGLPNPISEGRPGVCYNCGRQAGHSRAVTEIGYLCHTCNTFQKDNGTTRPSEPGNLENQGFQRSVFGPGKQPHKTVLERRIRNLDRYNKLVGQGTHWKDIYYEMSEPETESEDENEGEDE
jgi:hypothetical protein